MCKFLRRIWACIFLVFFLFNLSPTLTVNAEPVYMRVITEQTPFYKNENDSLPLFYLPYTYYVKVLSTNKDLTHVECYGLGDTACIDGFVPTDYLYKDYQKVENPYVVLTITTVSTAVMYEDCNLTSAMQYVFPNRALCYYGALPHENGLIFYVSYNDKLGYVKESDVYPFSIPNHPNELTFLTPDTPTNEQNKPSAYKDASPIKIAIILCIIVAGLIALFVVLGNKKDKTASTLFYDENDYE